MGLAEGFYRRGEGPQMFFWEHSPAESFLLPRTGGEPPWLREFSLGPWASITSVDLEVYLYKYGQHIHWQPLWGLRKLRSKRFQLEGWSNSAMVGCLPCMW